jgi:hypothetical protein
MGVIAGRGVGVGVGGYTIIVLAWGRVCLVTGVGRGVGVGVDFILSSAKTEVHKNNNTSILFIILFYI